jgi:hypothetical protein
MYRAVTPPEDVDGVEHHSDDFTANLGHHTRNANNL